MEFSVSYDRRVQLMSAIYGVSLVFLSGFFAFSFPDNAAVSYWGALLPFLLLLLVFLRRVVRYELRQGELFICCPLYTKRIALAQVISISFDPEAMAGYQQGMAINGFFGFSGRFYNPRWRHFTAYVTHCEKTVVITTTKGIYIVSPDDVELFVLAVQSILKATIEQDARPIAH